MKKFDIDMVSVIPNEGGSIITVKAMCGAKVFTKLNNVYSQYIGYIEACFNEDDSMAGTKGNTLIDAILEHHLPE